MPLAAVAQMQTLQTYVSPAIVSNPPPNVNATNFVNGGVWNIDTSYLGALEGGGIVGYSPLPYQTANTLNYTNTGTMNGSLGWEFDHGPVASGVRNWSASFFNDNNGTISALDGYLYFLNSAASGILPETSYLLISATNIVNKGLLSAGPNGEIIINGSSVNMTRGGLEITALVGTGSSDIINSNEFIPDTAIYDEFWLGGTNMTSFVGANLWNGTTVGTFSFFNAFAPCLEKVSGTFPSFIPQAVDSYTNVFNNFTITTTNSSGIQNTNLIPAYSNEVRQAIFVYEADPGVTPSVRFGPQISPTNYFLPMAAQFLGYLTNVVTGQLQANTVYVADDLAAVGTNGYLLKNLEISPSAPCTDPTYRPDSVVVSRDDSTGDYTDGSSGYGLPPSDFFYEPLTFSNYVAAGRADVYSALVDNLAAEPPAGFAETNAPGKIEIFANNLNLSKARMSAASVIQVFASNLVSSAGASMDCQNLNYELGSTNGTLNFTNLANPICERLHGPIYEWSGLWTNYQTLTYTNFATNSVTGGFTRSDLTNVVEVDLAMTVVFSYLSNTIPVIVQNLTLHSTNMIVSDTVSVTNQLLFDGQSLTIQSGGGLTLATGLPNWTRALAPKLLYFTNNGYLVVPNDAHFGDDGPTNYATFVNNGTITAGSETINSTIFQGGGAETVSGSFNATTSAGQVQNGSISGQSVHFTAGTLKLLNASITSGDLLSFIVTNALYDAGGSSSNTLICNNGFDLAAKPPVGDLIGTKLESIAPEFAGVDHYWPGVDLGAVSAGYTNNEAVGQLVLNEGTDSEFLFHATGASNAIYVDLLDLSKCPDFLDPDVLTIDPNFVIYYAAAKLPSTFTVPANTNGIPQEAEEFLNGQLGGHLRWVSSFAGPNSSVAVLINGQTAYVNKALRYSKIIDSNDNGIPNYYDPNPFNPTLVLSGSMVQTNPPPANTFAISWTAAANAVYQVQYSTNISPANWLPLRNYTNNASTSVVVSVWDTNAVPGQRYYRVSHQ